MFKIVCKPLPKRNLAYRYIGCLLICHLFPLSPMVGQSLVWRGSKNGHGWPTSISTITTQLPLWLVQGWAVILGLNQLGHVISGHGAWRVGVDAWSCHIGNHLLGNSTKSFHGPGNLPHIWFGEAQSDLRHKKICCLLLSHPRPELRREKTKKPTRHGNF
jgi:hypothetical protein